MCKIHNLLFSLFIGLLINFAAVANDDSNAAISSYASNVARIIQDFETGRPKSYLRPDKFCLVDVGSTPVLWVSTQDEQYGLLFSNGNGRLENILTVGEIADMGVIKLSFMNNIMVVSDFDASGNLVKENYFRLNIDKLDELNFQLRKDGESLQYFNAKGKVVKEKDVLKELHKGLKKGQEAELLTTADMKWQPFRKMGNYLDAATDITLSQHPVLTYANYKNNEFTTHAASMLPAEQYRHIVFKKQVGDATLKSASDATAVYSLNDSKAVKTLFKGYKENELYPILATEQYVLTHQMMPFSRWKYPERVTPMEKEKQKAVSEHFGYRKVKNSRWLANLEESDRKLYAVEFEPIGNQALAVIACFIGNRLVSTFDQYAVVDASRGWLWTPGDKGNFMNALPELQGLAVTDEGFELYMSQMVGEHRRMIVLREVRSMFIELINQEF